MNRPFRKAALALLLVFLSFRINQYDLLPDAVGFAVAAMALGSVPPHPWLRSAQIVAWVGCVVSVPRSLGLVYEQQTDTESMGVLTSTTTTWRLTDTGTSLDYVQAVAQLALVLLLCFGIRDIAGAGTTFGRRANRVGMLAASMYAVVFVVSLLELWVLFVPSLIAGVIVVVVFLRFLFAADREVAALPALSDAPGTG